MECVTHLAFACENCQTHLCICEIECVHMRKDEEWEEEIREKFHYFFALLIVKKKKNTQIYSESCSNGLMSGDWDNQCMEFVLFSSSSNQPVMPCGWGYWVPAIRKNRHICFLPQVLFFFPKQFWSLLDQGHCGICYWLLIMKLI